MQYSLVSILLPLYNEPVLISRESIISICNQSYEHLEILLLLDNPQNGDIKKLMNEFASRDTRIKCILNEKNLGLPETLNRGIDLASGEYIARMDADDISFPERIEKQLNYMLLHQDIDLLGCNAVIIDEEGQKIGRYSKLTNDSTIKFFLKHCNSAMIHPTWFGKAEVFKKCRYRNFLSGQDYDFLLRAYANGFRFHNLEESLLKYRIPRNSLQSISLKKAYEQYIHANIARNQFKIYLRTGVYPALSVLSYDMADKEKYMKTIPLLNQLREAIYDHRYILSVKLFYNITLMDKRPIVSRMKANILFRLLTIVDRIIM